MGDYVSGRRLHPNDPVAFPTRTVEVRATTSPPAGGFMVGGLRVERGEQVRLTLGDAEGLVRAGKARIVPDTEKVELL